MRRVTPRVFSLFPDAVVMCPEKEGKGGITINDVLKFVDTTE